MQCSTYYYPNFYVYVILLYFAVIRFARQGWLFLDKWLSEEIERNTTALLPMFLKFFNLLPVTIEMMVEPGVS